MCIMGLWVFIFIFLLCFLFFNNETAVIWIENQYVLYEFFKAIEQFMCILEAYVCSTWMYYVEKLRSDIYWYTTHERISL